tara:strand:+ start:49 stop:471 length:423 start_codon:yes stop_codon:yes gene_type:complete
MNGLSLPECSFYDFYDAGKFVDTEINIFDLPNVQSQHYCHLPNIPAVYFFVENKTILYIGHSQALRKRIQTHRQRHQHANRLFSGISSIYFLKKYIGKDIANGCVEESAFIQKYKPIFNVSTPIKTWAKTDVHFALINHE